MPKLTLTDFSSLANETSFLTELNTNFADIETAIENTLSRDGTSPNTMSANLDMNSNSITNAASVQTTGLVVNGVAVEASQLTSVDLPTLAGLGDALKLVRADATGANYELVAELPTSAYADSSVTTAKIADDNITTAKIADDNVTKAKMAPDSVGLTELDDSEVYASQAEAEAGTDTTKIMTAQRVKQYADANIVSGPTLLSTTNVASGASVDLATVFSANTGYTYYRIVFAGIAPSSNATILRARLSTDGSTFASGVSDYEWAYTQIGPTGASVDYQADNSDAELELLGSYDIVDFATTFHATFDIASPNTADEHPIWWDCVLPAANASSGMARSQGCGMYNSASAVTGIQFSWSTGNFAAQGTIKVYGSNIPF